MDGKARPRQRAPRVFEPSSRTDCKMICLRRSMIVCSKPALG